MGGKGREGEEKEERGRNGREKGGEGREGGRLRHGFWGMDAPVDVFIFMFIMFSTCTTIATPVSTVTDCEFKLLNATLHTTKTGCVYFENARLLYVTLHQTLGRQVEIYAGDGLPGRVRDIYTTVIDGNTHWIGEHGFVARTNSAVQIIALYLPDKRNNGHQ